jgi:hypothetical protein
MVCHTEFRLFRRTKNSRNSVVNHSTEEETSWNSVPWNKQKKLRNFVLKHFAEENTLSILLKQKTYVLNRFLKTWQPPKIFYKPASEKTTFEVRTNHFVKLFCLFCKLIFCVIPFCSELRNCPFVDLGMSTFFCGITETVSDLFCEIFRKEIPFPNPNTNYLTPNTYTTHLLTS